MEKKNENALDSSGRYAFNLSQIESRNATAYAAAANQRASNSYAAVPEPRNHGKFTLADLVGEEGASQIKNSGRMIIHSTGDTGKDEDDYTEMVARAMTNDFQLGLNQQHNSPAFFLHLGDVVYSQNNDDGYNRELYYPYRGYPGKMIAIPGDNDGKTNVNGTHSFDTFIRHFCYPQTGVQPPVPLLPRAIQQQPGLYWWLSTPFANFIGLCTNTGPYHGMINRGTGGQKQYDWFRHTLGEIASESKSQRKFLVIAGHHPVYSEINDQPSIELHQELKNAFMETGVYPHLVLAGHSHNYQRFLRSGNYGDGGPFKKVHYIVAGSGGHGITTVSNSKPINKAVCLKLSNRYGYLKLSFSPLELTCQFFGLSPDCTLANLNYSKIDEVTIPL